MEDRHPSCTAVVSLAVVLISSVTAVAHTHAQTAPAFETTSIRRNPPRDALPIAVVRGDRFFAPSTTLRDLIRVANLVEEIQISGGPAWIESERFAIEASTGPGVSPDDARAMIRVLSKCGTGPKLALCSRHQLRAVHDAAVATDSRPCKSSSASSWIRSVCRRM
jgi:hypothetical protein